MNRIEHTNNNKKTKKIKYPTCSIHCDVRITNIVSKYILFMAGELCLHCVDSTRLDFVYPKRDATTQYSCGQKKKNCCWVNSGNRDKLHRFWFYYHGLRQFIYVFTSKYIHNCGEGNKIDISTKGIQFQNIHKSKWTPLLIIIFFTLIGPKKKFTWISFVDYISLRLRQVNKHHKINRSRE